MRDRTPVSWVLFLYYSFLLLGTVLSYGNPYPLFGSVLSGSLAEALVVVDSLLLLHILIGIWKGQRLSWYLLVFYGGFELASLGATLLWLGVAGIAEVLGGDATPQAVKLGAAVTGCSLFLVTAYAVRLRSLFENQNPFLF